MQMLQVYRYAVQRDTLTWFGTSGNTKTLAVPGRHGYIATAFYRPVVLSPVSEVHVERSTAEVASFVPHGYHFSLLADIYYS